MRSKSMTSVLAIALVAQLGEPALAAPARPASAFVDSIGVNTHFNYSGTTYDHLDDIIVPRLQELGIRHLRDHMYNHTPGHEQVLRSLGDEGFRFLLITQIDQSSDQIAGFIKRVGPAIVDTVEGPNEYDLHGGENWPAELKAHTRMLWSTIKDDAELSQITVAGPTLVDWMVDSYPALGDQSAFMDVGNFHWYFAGWPPSATGAEDKKLSIITDRYSTVTGDKKFINSEGGYHNALTDRRFHWGTPEDVTAKYIPQMFLFQFGYGILRTYSYELADAGSDPNNRELSFGLIRHDGEPKPAFFALRNLIQLLSDPGPAFEAKELDFDLTGNTEDIQTVLVQKRDGAFYLAVWSGKPIWHPVDQVVLTPAPQRLTLAIEAELESIGRAQPNHGVDWEALPPQAKSWSITANDEVQLFRIVPKGIVLLPPAEPGPVDPAGPPAPVVPMIGEPSAPTTGAPGVSAAGSASMDGSLSSSAANSAGSAAGCACGVQRRSGSFDWLALAFGLLLLSGRRRAR